jgi:hypothetical protein
LSSWVHADASPTVHCRPLLASGGNFGAPATPPHDGAHSFAAWLKPRPTLANAAAFEGWQVAQWVHAGALALADYATSADDLHVAVLSPRPGFAYGGGAVASQLQYAGPSHFFLCLQWREAAAPHCRLLGGDLSTMPDSPHPEDTVEGWHMFSAWVAEPAATSKRDEGSPLLPGAVRLRVDVPYRTFRSSPRKEPRYREGSTSSRNSSAASPRLASPPLPRPRAMTDARVQALWQRLGLGVATDRAPDWQASTRAAAAARAASMQHSRDVAARIAGLGLPRRGRDALHGLLRGPFDFSRVLAACDFAEWTAKSALGFAGPRRPLSVLSTDPRDVEMELLDWSGLPKLTRVVFPAGRGAGEENASRARASATGTAATKGPPAASQSVTAFSFDPGRGVGDLHRLLPGCTFGGGSAREGGSSCAAGNGSCTADEADVAECPAVPRLPGEPFDLAIVSQTLEHLYDPVRQNLVFVVAIFLVFVLADITHYHGQIDKTPIISQWLTMPYSIL